jgi:hypothetical protein
MDRASNNIFVGLASVFTVIMYYYSSKRDDIDTEDIVDTHSMDKASLSHVTFCENVSSTNLGDNYPETPMNNSLNSLPVECCYQTSFIHRSKNMLHMIGLLRITEPRLLTANDPIFNYVELRKGLSRRSKDETQLRQLAHIAKEARDSGDPKKVAHVMHQISQIAYGDNVTPQMRENFCVRYGCTGWTEEILAYLLQLSRSRGIVEIGAGNGQWARILSDRYEEEQRICTADSQRRKQTWDFLLAFDTMTDLPLSPQVYHNLTQPARDFFFPRVKKCLSHVHAIRRFECRGRILLLVYPPPGDMALETVQAYVDAYPQGNDIVVYVGEGIGGANANDAFFEYFLSSGHWCILKIMNVHPPLGGKGYEKVFVLKRIQSNEVTINSG